MRAEISTAHSSKLVCAVRQGEFVIAQPAGRYDSPRAGYWSADDLAGLDHVLHAGALIVLILRAGYSCPLDRLAASRLLPPRSRLERSDLVLWPIAAFRGSFGNRVALGIADSDIDTSRRRDLGYIRAVEYADAKMRREATAR